MTAAVVATPALAGNTPYQTPPKVVPKGNPAIAADCAAAAAAAGPKLTTPGRHLIERDATDGDTDNRSCDFRRRFPGPGVFGELAFEVRSILGIVCVPSDGLENETADRLDARIGKHRLGQGIAGRFPRALSVRKLKQLGVDEPLDLLRDSGLLDDLLLSHPVCASFPSRASCQLRAGHQPELRDGQYDIDRGTEHVPAHRVAVQLEGPGDGEVLVDERVDALARAHQISVEPVHDDLTSEVLVEVIEWCPLDWWLRAVHVCSPLSCWLP